MRNNVAQPGEEVVTLRYFKIKSGNGPDWEKCYDTYFPGGVMWEEFALMLSRIGFGATIRDNLAARSVKNEAWQTAAATFVKGEDFRAPMLFIGGWYDIYADGVISAFETVRAKGAEKARAHSRLIIGPWVHGIDQVKNGQLEFPNAHLFGMKKARAFIDHWVRGIPNGFDKSLIISSSNYPKYALNLNDGGPMYRKGDGLVATNSVYAGKQHPLVLILPVVTR